MMIKDSDLSAVLLGSDPGLIWHFLQKACLHSEPSISGWFKGMLRIPQLPSTYRDEGIELLHYKSFLAEWRYPLSASDKRYLESLLPDMGKLAQSLDLTEEELSFWQTLCDDKSEAYFLTSPDFYFREAFALVVGKVR